MKDILLVDDDEQFRALLSTFLQQCGFRVQEASEGNEALRLHEHHRFDLIITDLIMPGREGLSAILELRRKDRQVKIVAMSGGGRVSPDSYLPVAKKFGAHEILAKPFPLAVLLETVHRVLK
ncbi:MAG: response regulator [Acidobacteriota bacterium]